MNLTQEEINLFWSRVNKTDSCWLWTAGKFKFGHGNFWVSSAKLGQYAHRIAFFLTKGYLPEPPLCILHNCPGGDNPACVNPAHLWVGTKKENNQDKMRKGRCNAPIGERQGRAILTEVQVKEIIQKYEARELNQVELASAYGVTQSAISLIVRKRNWAYLHK